MHKRVVIFVSLFLLLAAALGAYLYHVKTRVPEMRATQRAVPPASPENPSGHALLPATTQTIRRGEPQRIFFRHNGVDGHYGMLAHADLATLDQVIFSATLKCESVHVSGGKGICLTAKRGVLTTYAALLFDASTLQITARIPLNGIPSRCRVSRDGKIAALTVFVTGHGYTTLDFSTQTLLIDIASGTVLADVENFAVSREGKAFKEQDFNFWGVTFTADAKNFFATLSTGGKHFLVSADIAGRTAKVIHENVECPSLSPDARRIAYKKRFQIDGRILWQLHVLDLDSGAETALAEKRSIDDQLEWLDSAHVLYSVPADEAGSAASTDVWMASVDGNANPTLFLRNAYSPAVER